MSKFAKLLKRIRDNDPTLTQLNLKKMSPAKIKELAEAMRTNSHVSELEIHHKEINKESMEALAMVVKDNSLISLRLICSRMYGVKIGMKDMVSVARDTALDEDLRDATISVLDAECVTILADALAHNTTLASLYLFWEIAPPKYLTNLVEKLQGNQALTSLWLIAVCPFSSANGSRKDFFNAVAKLLETNKKLVSLDLSRNYMDNEEIAIFSTALTNNQTLKEFVMCRNPISKYDIKLFADMLKANQTLEFLNITKFKKNVDSYDRVSMLRDALQDNYSLLELAGFASPQIERYLARNRALVALLPRSTAQQRKIWDQHYEEIISLARGALSSNSLFSQFHNIQRELNISVLQKVIKAPFEDAVFLYDAAISICQAELKHEEAHKEASLPKLRETTHFRFPFSLSKVMPKKDEPENITAPAVVRKK